ncbi:hypothetical protein INS49_005559 [Diaporthe citri]|uniref:uncharacterized protein n=1 Tax=Diaporthe citri TaxID=83186 RepID=UPI001C7E4844|nr:uncharacterized protein INS49_005559 [Diaporthe citri]KAG6353597.1 hypothetical protein INS49_005559 [Diaporthe citri]
MSTLQHFHRFRDLPRELQLHIWELYECTQPRRRHYFRRMVYWSGHLYACADQYTDRRIANTANADDPDQTQVPDVAITPNTKIQLPSSGSWYQTYVSDSLHTSAATFGSIQTPTRMDSPFYIWANFKNDTFCFAANNGLGGGKNFLQYLEGPTGLFPPASGPHQSPTMSHWFFRLQRLVLIKSTAIQTLGPLDRQVLGVHPSLRELTIVAVHDYFRCSHLALGTQIRPDNFSVTERLPLRTFVALRKAVTESCACDRPTKCLDGLERLRRDLVDLFQTRTNTAPPVDVGIEVEIYWAQ